MKSLAIQIKQKYENARNSGRLAKSGAMPLAETGGLLVVSRETLKRLEARIAELEREVDDWKTEASAASFRASGVTEDKLLSPSDIHSKSGVSIDIESGAKADGQREPYAEINIKAPRFALLEIFGSYFAEQSKQA